MMNRLCGMVLPLVMLGGCGGKTIDPELVTSSQEAYHQAVLAVRAGDDEKAIAFLDTALSNGGVLAPDMYEEALVHRAVCLARSGRFDDAHVDLDAAAQGAADMASVHIARSYVYRKQGKASESRAAALTAKKINPRVKTLRD